MDEQLPAKVVPIKVKVRVRATPDIGEICNLNDDDLRKALEFASHYGAGPKTGQSFGKRCLDAWQGRSDVCWSEEGQ